MPKACKHLEAHHQFEDPPRVQGCCAELSGAGEVSVESSLDVTEGSKPWIVTSTQNTNKSRSVVGNAEVPTNLYGGVCFTYSWAPPTEILVKEVFSEASANLTSILAKVVVQLRLEKHYSGYLNMSS